MASEAGLISSDNNCDVNEPFLHVPIMGYHIGELTRQGESGEP